MASNLKIELEKWVKSETCAKNKNMIDLNKKLGYEVMYHKMVKSME